MTSLPARLASAAVAAAVLFSLYFYFRETGLFYLTGFVIFIALIEFTQFLRPGLKSSRSHHAAFVLAGTTVYALSHFSEAHVFMGFILSSLILFAYLLVSIDSDSQRKRVFRSQCFTMLGLFYCAVLPAMIAQLFKLPDGAGWYLTLLAIILGGDTFAFAFGLTFGGKKLLPIVSPKKTWSGSIGGLLGSVLFGCSFTYWFVSEPNYFAVAWIALICAIFGQVGDLFESLVKRVAGIKDSGKIMPGHGGILDRIDGVLFAGPVFFYLLKFFYF